MSPVLAVLLAMLVFGLLLVLHAVHEQLDVYFAERARLVRYGAQWGVAMPGLFESNERYRRRLMFVARTWVPTKAKIIEGILLIPGARSARCVELGHGRVEVFVRGNALVHLSRPLRARLVDRAQTFVNARRPVATSIIVVYGE